MKYTTAIFDLDGTLLDTITDLAEASNGVLREFGFPVHPEESYNYFVGDGLKTLMARVTPAETAAAVIEECCDSFMQKYGQCWDRNSKPYQGIPEMLRELRRLGMQCAVLSNKPHAFTEVFVNRFFGPDMFAAVYGQRDGVPKKPDPAGALEIMAKLSTFPERCIYVGDTSTDMKTGKSGGMFTIGVLWGFRGRDELEEHDADLIVQTPMEIVEHVIAAG